VKAAPFSYQRPERVDEALRMLEDPDAKAIAGGQSLVPMMAMRLARPAVLVDLNGLGELEGVADRGGTVTVGALTRQRALERWPDLAGRLPLVAAALPMIGHREIRNRGTVGGSVAHADPAAELLLVAATLRAELVARRADGTRLLAGEDFCTGPFQTRLEPGELLTEVRFPAARAGEGFAFEEVARRHGDFALCGAAVHARPGERVAVGLLGVGPTPRVFDVREELGEDPDSDRFGAVAADVAGRLDPSSDAHAGAAYRRRLARVLVRRCLERAWQSSREAA
jgi:CO/xanthine dehydrogenase FAD-binding subunit